MSVIWDIDTQLGCWIDGSNWSAIEFNMMLSRTAEHYGFQRRVALPKDDYEAWQWEGEDAYDYLNSICPHDYWFEIEDNSLFLRSEDGDSSN